MPDTDTVSQLSLPALGALFVGGMAVLAISRGVLRLIRGVAALAIGLVVGTVVFLQAPTYLAGVVDNPSGKLLAGLSVIGGALGHLGSRFTLGKLLGGLDAAAAAGQTLSKGKAALISLLPSGFLMWAGGIFIRLTGSLSGMEHLDEGKAGDWPWLAQARQVLSQGTLGRIFNATDPVTSPETLRLCEILVSYRVDERFQKVRKDPDFQGIVTHPLFQRLLKDREVRHAVAHSNYARLLTLPEIRAAVADPTLARELRALPEERIVRAEPVE